MTLLYISWILNLGMMRLGRPFGLGIQTFLVRAYGFCPFLHFYTAVVNGADACVNGVGYNYQLLFGLKLYIHLEHNK